MHGLAKESRIVNPMAKTIMTLVVNDQFQTELKSELPPRDTVKILMNLVADLTFGYSEALVAATKRPNLEDVGDGHVNDQHAKS